jgi:predicted amidohydrolase YtcJ
MAIGLFRTIPHARCCVIRVPPWSGSLEPGKEADIAVWDRNIYSVPSSELKQMKCEMTFFHGKVVYEAH